MYFPYLRGKQFEMIALRELSYLPVDPTLIHPILEPVKNINNTFLTSLTSCLTGSVNLNIILNPKVGYYSTNSNGNLIIHCNNHINLGMPLTPAFIIMNPNDLNNAASTIRTNSYNNGGYTLIHKGRISDPTLLVDFFNEFPNVKYNVIETNIGARYNRNFQLNTIVNLSDPFITEIRNANFLTRPEEEFTEEHLYFATEGLAGFSDYLTIGSDYSETGFLPYAVAIHLTYHNQIDNKIWIRHFASISNDDYSDPAGKFGEALNKLVFFIDSENIRTYASDEFRSLNHRGAYPGLGVIKKLSILHHIQLVQSLL